MKLARFALNDRTPHADFDLSLYLYGLLIPVGYLVNGRSIIAGVLVWLNYATRFFFKSASCNWALANARVCAAAST